MQITVHPAVADPSSTSAAAGPGRTASSRRSGTQQGYRVKLVGRPAVTVPTSGPGENLPSTVWVLAPLPVTRRTGTEDGGRVRGGSGSGWARR
jgi:hypothetical protein